MFRVLKPPGGGSSDIFGLGNSYHVANKETSERTRSEESNNTHDRVFGGSNITNVSTPAKNNVQSNIFENGNQVVPKQKKVYGKNFDIYLMLIFTVIFIYFLNEYIYACLYLVSLRLG